MRQREAHAMTYGVTVQTLDRTDGNGITVVFVDADDELDAEHEARRIAELRFGCSVLVDHAVPWS
jgi:hypothetical protein